MESKQSFGEAGDEAQQLSVMGVYKERRENCNTTIYILVEAVEREHLIIYDVLHGWINAHRLKQNKHKIIEVVYT